jgi:hypothetical protein
VRVDESAAKYRKEQIRFVFLVSTVLARGHLIRDLLDVRSVFVQQFVDERF